MTVDTRDPGRVRLCAGAQGEDDWRIIDLLTALELLLPFAPTAPAWATQAARDAIEQAKGKS